jgi:hypothetical protein
MRSKPPSPLRGRRTTPRPWLRPLRLPHSESRRLSSPSWLLHAKPWTRPVCTSVPLPLLERRRRPLLITWNSSSPQSKGSLPPMMTMATIAPLTPAPTPTPPLPHTCLRRLPTSRKYDQWSRSFWNPRRPTTSGGATSCFSRFIDTPWTTTSSPPFPIHPPIGLGWTTSW